MKGLTLEQEAALTICYANQDGGRNDFTNLGISRAFVSLRDMGMIRMETDINMNLVLFLGMLPAGASHYDEARRDRRRFRAVGDSADELMMALAVQDKAKKDSDELRLVVTDLGNVADYQDLQNAGLIDVQWADNKPWTVSVTNDGRSYAEGWFLDQMIGNPQSSDNSGYHPMFSLVVRANPSQPIDLSRLFEGSKPEFSSLFMMGDTPDLASLIRLPAILTQEFEEGDEDAVAVLGYIDRPSLNPVITHPIITFPSQRLLDLGILGRWGNKHTHWGLHEGDPFKLFAGEAINAYDATSIDAVDLSEAGGGKTEVNPRLVAVMMPFAEDPNRDPVYLAIKRACLDSGLVCKRVDEIFTPSNIVDDIKDLIASAGIVIADLTEKNPNVMYELGYAHGRDKLVICIQQGHVDLPFDIGHNRTFSYKNDQDGLSELVHKLTLALNAFTLPVS